MPDTNGAIEKPFEVDKLVVNGLDLFKALQMFRPKYELEIVWKTGVFEDKELEAIKSLNIKGLEIECEEASVELLQQLSSL